MSGLKKRGEGSLQSTLISFFFTDVTAELTMDQLILKVIVMVSKNTSPCKTAEVRQKILL